MAVYPCDWSAHRYPEAQRSVYLTIASDDLVETRKLRFCEKHLADEMSTINAGLALVDEDSRSSSSCELCGKQREMTLYAKVFSPHVDPTVYAVDVCASDAATLLGALKWASGRAMAGR